MFVSTTRASTLGYRCCGKLRVTLSAPYHRRRKRKEELFSTAPPQNSTVPFQNISARIK